MTQSPLFIAFEGIDGSGKSTQVKLLADKLNANGHTVHLTAEPTKGPIGKMIREIFAGKQFADQGAIAGLFVADRLQHIHHPEEGMLQLLQQGTTVITDRYYLSSYAYHSVFVDMDWVIEANKLAAQALKADITIYIEMQPEESMQRIAANRQSTEMYETLENLTAVKNNYTKAIEKVNAVENIVTIKGNRTPEEVHEEIFSYVQNFRN
jgi:dTMP kinase